MAAVHEAEDDERPLGAGFLIDSRRVMTCAHVVCEPWKERSALWVAFPKSDHIDRRVKVIQVISPEPRAKRRKEDVAVLVLAECLTEEAPARLRQPANDDLLGEAWWSFGFPNGDMFGNSATGTVGESQAYGRVRLDTESRYTVTRGFSGAALWSPTYQAVVGMVCEANNTTGDARALTLHKADRWLPAEKLGLLTRWTAEAAGDSALASWGWTLDSDPEAGRHWRPRARGVSTDAERGFRFRGRTAAMTEIVSWMTSGTAPRQVLMVTGSPGVGKSAVLGRIVTSADPKIAASLPAGDDAVRAPLGSVSCAVHAKGKMALEVAHEIARAASASLPDVVEDLAPALRDALTNRTASPTPFTVVIDALDEATSPKHTRLITTGIAMPLAETCADLQVRVLIGSRRRDDAGDLLTTFGSAARVIDLDTPKFFAKADLTAYALATLQLLGDERPDPPYADDAVARPIAERIAELADGNFLVAGLIARSHGLHDTTAVAPADISLTSTVAEALHEYLIRIAPVGGIPASVVLTALAYSEAPGLPLPLWRTAITALADAAPSEDQLHAFARSSAANFLVETSIGDHSTGTFRLFHQALDDALLRERAKTRPAAEDEGALTRAFISHGRAGGWNCAPRYLLRSLPRHASRARAIDELLADDAYALHADLHRLIAAVGLARGDDARDRAQLLRQTPLAIDASPGERAALFSVTEAQERLGHAYRTLDVPSPYRAAWASVSPATEEAVLEGHRRDVRAVCDLRLHGRDLLASASDDGTVRLWDPISARTTRVLQLPAVRAMCGVVADGRTLLAVASENTVSVWDPTEERLLSVLEGHDSAVFALCTVDVSGRTLLATASADTSVRLWEPLTGRHVHTLQGHTNWVNAVCPVRVKGHLLLASGGTDGTVQLWNCTDGQQVRTLTSRDDGEADAVNALCAVRVGDRVLLASGNDRSIKLWDPDTGTTVRVVRGPTGTAYEVCAVEINGRSILASSSEEDAYVRLWDAATGEGIAALEGHSGDAVLALCVLDAAGHQLLASGADDHTIRLWNPARTRTSRASAVRAVCPVQLEGRELIASGGEEKVIRLWDPLTGETVGTLTGHMDCVRALCALSVDGRTLLASGAEDGTIDLWDPSTEEVVHTLTDDFHAVYALCPVFVDGRLHLAAASADDSVRLWEPKTGRLTRTLRSPNNRGFFAVCTVRSGDRTLLAAGASLDGCVRVWDPATGELEATYPHEGLNEDIYSICAVAPDDRGLLAIAGSDGEVRLWDVRAGDAVGALKGHSGPVNAVSAVDFNGRRLLATTSTDRTVRLWDPVSLSSVTEIPMRHPGWAVTSTADRLIVGLDRGIQAVCLTRPSSQ
ncbi:trypsin-like peptidase domain-containing protein [Streptomyces decoyicus]|nr:trypsin-like peptidase domain-containing protein [Streptomyces decoyicus]